MRGRQRRSQTGSPQVPLDCPQHVVSGFAFRGWHRTVTADPRHVAVVGCGCAAPPTHPSQRVPPHTPLATPTEAHACVSTPGVCRRSGSLPQGEPHHPPLCCPGPPPCACSREKLQASTGAVVFRSTGVIQVSVVFRRPTQPLARPPACEPPIIGRAPPGGTGVPNLTGAPLSGARELAARVRSRECMFGGWIPSTAETGM